MSGRLLLLAVCAALVWPSQANAQIYMWRDAGGNLVLSDRRPDNEAVTYAVPDAPSFRVTRPATPDVHMSRLGPSSRSTPPGMVSAPAWSGP